ncbi:MAG TPA: AraC family transcriptional regulator [Victivallales bacterium]|nr:AraC family transcriptional regulator [Victivallales bacterium]
MAEVFSSLGLRILQVGWTRLGGWWNYNDLSAPYWRLYWNDSPGASVIFEGRRVALDPGKIYLISPDTAFSSIAPSLTKKVAHFYAHFAVESEMFHLPDSLFIFNATDSSLGEIREIIRLDECGESFKSEMRIISLLAGFLVTMPVRISGRTHGGRLRKAIEILKNHCERGISNTELASKFSMSTNSFLRFFKSASGISPQKYLRQIRIERACFMLHYTDKSIEEIAASLGFCDRYHFSKVFSESRGESPGAFRRKIYAGRVVVGKSKNLDL